jgi:DNA polymerase V
MASRSFGEPATDLAALSEIVSGFTTRVAAKLRAQHSLAAAVRVFITTSPYRRQDAQHSPSVTMPLVRPTSDTRALIAAALRALEGMYRPGHNYVKAGVMLMDLRDEVQTQGELDLFAEPSGPLELSTEATTRATTTNARLMSAVDALNLRFGLGAVGVASGLQREQGAGRHAARQERRSPRYTTRLDEIVTVKA